MDFVAKTDETAIMAIVQPTVEAFMSVLEKKRAEFESVPRKTFQYGITDRQQMDVYYPDITKDSPIKAPFLFFIYGGMFVQGNRVWPAPNDLGYTSLGSFYAKQGFITVIPDYRLVPSVKFPEPVEDVRDAVIYAVQNITEGDPNKIFILGHSAGAAHTSSLFLVEPSLLQSTTLQPRIKGIILMGGAYDFRGSLAPAQILAMYYGSVENAGTNCPYSLLDHASQETLDALPPIFMLMAEKEPSDIAVNNDAFAALLEKKLGKEIKRSIAKGHNHISPSWAVGSGQGEEWGFEVVEWIKQHL